MLPVVLLGLLAGAIILGARKRDEPAAAPQLPAPTPTPQTAQAAAEQLLMSTLDPGMSPALSKQVQDALRDQTDPAKLEYFAELVQKQGYPMSARALAAKASAIRVTQGAAAAMAQVESVLKQPTPPPAPVVVAPQPVVAPRPVVAPQPVAVPTPVPVKYPASPTQVKQQGETAIASAAEAAAKAPAVAPAMQQAANVAATAMQAAATGDPVKAAAAVKEATVLAQQFPTEEVKKAAATAVETLTKAVNTGDPQHVTDAISAATDAATTAVTQAQSTTALHPQPAVEPSDVAMHAHLAANEIRAKGCWKEDRGIIQRYQEKEQGKAGKVDGMWGMKTALAAMKHMPKVPAPCYWPTVARASAKDDWQKLLDEGKVTVGQLAMARAPNLVASPQQIVGTA